MAADEPLTLRTVERAFQTLEIIAAAYPPPSIKSVAASLGVGLSSAYHLVNTLIALEYVCRDGEKRLVLGPAVGRLYRGYLEESVTSRTLDRILSEFSDEVQETVYLTKRVEQSVVVAAMIEGRRAVRVTGIRIGFSGDEHRRASGKAVLAFLPEVERAAVTARVCSEQAGLEPSDFAAELEEIRRTRVAMDIESYSPDLCCVASPYFLRGTVGGSIAVSVPTSRYEGQAGTLAAAVSKHAERITEELGTGTGMSPQNGSMGARPSSPEDPHA